LLIDQENEPLHSTIILNPRTGKVQEFASDYPGIYSIDAPYRKWGRYAFTATVYDSALTRVVYLANLPDTPSSKLNYAIWDLQANNMIADLELIAWSVVEHDPVWSPTGNEFIVAYPESEELDLNHILDEELYSVSRNGEVAKLTNLSAYFRVGVDISHYSWAPDGRYVAFWMEPNPPAGLHDPHMELAVLDMASQEVTLFCIQGDFRHGGWAPVWSPNSQQVMVKILDEAGIGEIAIVDIIHEVAFRVAGDLNPYGWMVTPP
jgi:hypothetical protein